MKRLRIYIKGNKGFTLIEVLISIAVLSIILYLAVYSLKYALNILKFTEHPYTQNLIAISQLRDSINSLFFYLQEDEKERDARKKFKFFFKGNNRSIEFATTFPIYGKRDNIYIEKIFYKNKNLYVVEYPMYNPNVNYKTPKIPQGIKPKILLKNINRLEIKYFTDKWSSSLKNQIPKKIKLFLEDINGKKINLIFKPESNFYLKKILSEYLYNPN